MCTLNWLTSSNRYDLCATCGNCVAYDTCIGSHECHGGGSKPTGVAPLGALLDERED